MKSSDLRHRITIQQKSFIRDTYGQPVEEWSDVFTVWASINPLTGKDLFAAESVQSEITHKIKIRFKLGIKPDMRVRFGDRYFQIISPPINFNERNIELQLMCRELV
jgi:SPP1 family predicted phage head-tail adaptor